MESSNTSELDLNAKIDNEQFESACLANTEDSLDLNRKKLLGDLCIAFKKTEKIRLAETIETQKSGALNKELNSLKESDPGKKPVQNGGESQTGVVFSMCLIDAKCVVGFGNDFPCV